MPYLNHDTKAVVALEKEELSRERWLNKTALSEMAGFDLTSFGTAAEILADRRWVARYNKAVQINLAADEEYEATKEQIVDWVVSKVKTNLPTLVSAIRSGELRAPVSRNHGFAIGQHTEDKNILTIKEWPLGKHMDWYSDYSPHMGLSERFALHRGYVPRYGGRYRCYFDGHPSTFVATFEVSTPEGIAAVCGCAIAELPDVLQHYYKQAAYSGNSILDRIDPLEWVANNPWRQLNLDIRIYLSKRSYARLLKGSLSETMNATH